MEGTHTSNCHIFESLLIMDCDTSSSLLSPLVNPPVFPLFVLQEGCILTLYHVELIITMSITVLVVSVGEMFSVKDGSYFAGWPRLTLRYCSSLAGTRMLGVPQLPRKMWLNIQSSRPILPKLLFTLCCLHYADSWGRALYSITYIILLQLEFGCQLDILGFGGEIDNPDAPNTGIPKISAKLVNLLKA